MSKEMKMVDVWGFGNVPQDYTKFNGYQHDNGDWDDACYGLLFLTEEAADAQAHALRNHDRLVEENAALCEAVARLISSGVAFQNLDEMDNTLDSGDIASVEAKFNDELIRAGKLLAKLGEDNENQQAD